MIGLLLSTSIAQGAVCDRFIGLAVGGVDAPADFENIGTDFYLSGSPMFSMGCAFSVSPRMFWSWGFTTAPIYGHVAPNDRLLRQWLGLSAGLGWQQESTRITAFAHSGNALTGLGLAVDVLPFGEGALARGFRFQLASVQNFNFGVQGAILYRVAAREVGP